MDKNRITSPADVYRILEERWDGALNAALVDKICGSPEEHLYSAQVTWPKVEIRDEVSNGDTDRFGLRPVISPRLGAKVGAEVEKAIALSLHCDEIIMDLNILYPFGDPEEYVNYHHNDWHDISDDQVTLEKRYKIKENLNALIDLRPFIKAGVIIFGPLRNFSPDTVLWKSTASVKDEWMGRFGPDTPAPMEDFLDLNAANVAVASTLDLVVARHGSPTSSTPLEWKIWTAMFSEYARSKEVSQLQTLAQLRLPKLTGKFSEIAIIREDNESLGKWRKAFTGILEEAGRFEGAPNQIDRASAMVSGRLEKELAMLGVSMSSSNVLKSMLQGAVMPALLAGISLVPGAAAILPAAGVVGASGLAGAFEQYVKSRNTYRAEKALSDLAIHIGNI